MNRGNAEKRIVLENFARMKFLSLLFLGYSLFALFCDFAPFSVWNENALGIYRILDVVFTVLAIVSLLFFLLY